MRQRTIAREVDIEGRGLQTGRKVRMVCRPSGPDTGIKFRRKDMPGTAPLVLGGDIVGGGPKRRTTLSLGVVGIQTVEHFSAALWGAGIDNLDIEIDRPELPALDGSAKAYYDALRGAGIAEFSEEKRTIKIKEQLEVRDGESFLKVIPFDKFRISYHIDYAMPSIGSADLDAVMGREYFSKEIASARTFCTVKEALMLLFTGCGRGATLQNTLVMTGKGPLGTKLRYPDEPLRHKVLDLIGDLYMLGCPLEGYVMAHKSGHKLNGMLVKKIYERYNKL